MMLCKECGKELDPGDTNCPHCGTPQEQGAASEQDPPGVEAPATVPPVAKPKKKWLVPLIAVIGVLVVAAIVLVLVFVVFKGSSPDKTVKQFFTEFEKKDAAGITALVDTESFKQASGSEGAFKDILKKNMPQGYLRFENLVFDTSIKGNEATVTLTKGTVKQKAVSYTHLRAHETRHDLVCRLLLEKKKKKKKKHNNTKKKKKKKIKIKTKQKQH